MNSLISINADINIDLLDKYYVSNHMIYGLGYDKPKDFNWYFKTLLKEQSQNLIRTYKEIIAHIRLSIPIYPLVIDKQK